MQVAENVVAVESHRRKLVLLRERNNVRDDVAVVDQAIKEVLRTPRVHDVDDRVVDPVDSDPVANHEPEVAVRAARVAVRVIDETLDERRAVYELDTVERRDHRVDDVRSQVRVRAGHP